MTFLETISASGTRRYHVARGDVSFVRISQASFWHLKEACQRLDCFRTVTDRDGTVRQYCSGSMR